MLKSQPLWWDIEAWKRGRWSGQDSDEKKLKFLSLNLWINCKDFAEEKNAYYDPGRITLIMFKKGSSLYLF